jgi:hypothetical protein
MRTWQALSVSSAMHACMQPADRSNPTALDTNTNPVCHVDPPVVPWPVALLLLVCSSFACIRGRRQPAPAVSRAPRGAQRNDPTEKTQGNRGSVSLACPRDPWPPSGGRGPARPPRGTSCCLCLPRASHLAVACSMRHLPQLASEAARPTRSATHSTVQCAGPLHPKSCQYVASSEL